MNVNFQGLPADPSAYMGMKVQLWPHDTYRKIATVLSVDALGWTFKITETNDPALNIGDELFVSHSQPLIMRVIHD